MSVPSAKFNRSPRLFPEREPSVDYDAHFEVRLVSNAGTIKFRNRVVFLGDALSRERVGLEAIDDGLWSIQFGTFELARLDERTGDLA